MARVAEALKGLTAYLRAENTRLDIEFKEQKIDLAAETIAKKFQQLPPDATIQDMQALQFEVISDAAGLDSLQESLPLISGMYNSAMQTRSLVEQEKHDVAFAEGIQETLGLDVGQMTGDQAMSLFNAEMSSRKDVTTEDIEGRKTLREFNVKGVETFSMVVSPVTRAQILQEDFVASTNKARVTADLSLRNALILQQNKQKFESEKEFGVTGVRQFKGMSFLKAQTTPEGGQLYESKKGSALFVLEEGVLVAYQGDVIPRKSPQQAEDILDLIQKNRDLNQIQRFRLGTMLASSEQGREILSAILDRKIGSEAIMTSKQTGRKELIGTVMTELELAFGRDNIQERLVGLFGEENLQSAQDEFQALGLFGANILGEQEFEKQQYAKIPKSDYSNITNVAEWNRGSTLLRKFIENPQEYAGIAGSVYNYVNVKLGRPKNTPVSMSDINSLDFDNQMYLNRMLSQHHKNNLTLEAKTPTLKDITIPRTTKNLQEK